MSLYTDLVYRRIPQAVGVYVTGAWLGIEVTSAIFEAFELSKAATRLVFLLALAGFPVAMFVGWRYNITPRGIERTPEKAGWFARFFLGVVLVTVAAAIVMIQRSAVFGPSANTQSVAVLALRGAADFSDDGALGYAIADEILLELSELAGLRVAASTSSYAAAAASKDVRELAEAMQVRYVVEGSLRRSDSGVRAIVSIVDAQNGFRVWTGAFARTIKESSELAEAVADGVAAHLADAAGLSSPGLDRVASRTDNSAREEG